ncbi:hypothetical protein PRIPAC_90883 [Pristionchus pacificus]|uniref:Uncharacterized protein n=1 Tax=Pristionchus pacificus TaxID=54126 RepID=A0A2A6B9C7_PRIPA|nr:hypothetical protein PRIPAC_90883 [Pristionchus pacificus]|eukprot:PDM62476.1 hypothetical protein PRIPAC_51918 [Pristionchus pacificus]
MLREHSLAIPRSWQIGSDQKFYDSKSLLNRKMHGGNMNVMPGNGNSTVAVNGNGNTTKSEGHGRR